MIKTLIESPVSANEISKWVNQYYKWIKFHTRSKMNLAINTSFLVKAQYHEEEGRGGYFAPESGTSEGQFLSILGALEMYKTTKELKWLSLAECLSESTLRILFRNMEIPTAEFNKDYIYSPHWLFNATNESFTAEQYYLDKEVEFVNGIGTFNSSHTTRKIFSVRALDATLLWESPFSEIVGKEYKVTNYNAETNNFTIYLEESYTGKLLVVYSDMGGPQIEPDEVYEAYPIWRKLADTEIACAIDSLWWSYDCWKLLYELTGREVYNTILQNLKGLIKYACSIENAGDYLTTDLSNHNPLSTAGSYTYQERIPEASYSRDLNDGSIIIDVPAGKGFVQLGRGDINEELSKGRTWKLKYSNTKTSKIKVVASTAKTYNEDERWYYYFKSNNNSEITEIDITQEDFVKIDNILFDIYYKPLVEDIYSSNNSSVILTEETEDNGRVYRKIQFNRGYEYENGDSYLGWAQYKPILEKQLDYMPSFTYKTTDIINIRIKDELGWFWEYQLPIHTEFKSIDISLESFVLSSHQENAGESPITPSGIIQEILFDAVSRQCILELKEIGEFIEIPKDKIIYDMSIATSDEEAHTLKIYYLRPIPLEGYDYAPWVAPFTLNTINNRLDGWRGTPYVGYQCPWIWQELQEPEGVNTVLDFIRKSQEEYKRITGNPYGFFVQVFIWDRWDSREYGEPNTFTWKGPDPNTFWGGFQYRAIETVARTFYNDPNNEKAKLILEDFMSSLNTLWKDGTKPTPSVFNEDGTILSEYKDPHSVALILRAAIYCLLSGNFDSKLANDLISKSIISLQDTYNDNIVSDFNEPFTRGTWSIQNNEWYMYWGGEILQSLALLLRYMKNEFYIMTEEGAIVVDTYPEWYEIEKYIKIKTPSGNMKIEIVPIDHERATQFRIETEDGLMSIKGGTKMSSYELQLLKNNTNNAAKTITVDSIKTYLENSINGICTIRNIRGKSLKNISTIKQYDYLQNNWMNRFSIKPSTTYTVFADVLGTGSSVLTKSEKNSEDTDSSWQDLNNGVAIKNGDQIKFTFTTSADSVSFVLYLQQDGIDIQLDNIMIFEGEVKSKPSSYVADYINSAENGNLNIKIMVEGIEDKYSLLDISEYIDLSNFPLRSNGNVYDEINSLQLIKRIGDNNEILDTPLYYDLKKPLPILECWKDSSFFITSSGLVPESDISYPVLFETLIDERIQLNK